MEVYTTHNGTAAADTAIADDTQYSILKLGGISTKIRCRFKWDWLYQFMGLRASSTTAGVTVTAVRENVI